MPTGDSCGVCHNLDFTSLPHHTFPITDRELGTKRRSCRGCEVLARTVESYRALTNKTVSVYAGQSHRICTVGNRLTTVGDNLESVDVFTTRPQSLWHSVPLARLVASDGLSDACLDLAKSWLETCTRSHPNCSSEAQASWMPTRVIDIGWDETGPKVVVTAGLPSGTVGPRYAALSHCWGKHQLLTLTRDNLSRFQVEVPRQSLPRTFLDAFHVTRKLGLQYLWIDSLCIIQDDSDDWKWEATKMLQVYQSSALTIVADAGPDASYGLSSAASRKEWRQSRLQIPEVEHLYRRQARLAFVTHSGLVSHCPGREERSWVEARAWTFQERLIPSRKLYFGAYEMAWECRGMQTCECAGDDPAEMGWRRQTSTVFSSFWKEVDTLGDNNFSALWMRLVEEYTRRQLTFPSDTLPALAGAAALVAARHGKATYMAGVWKEYLHQMLLWRIDPGPSPSRRHDGYYAPSWTWASRVSDEGSRVVFDISISSDSDLVPGFGIQDAYCTYPDGNILLPPLTGHIDLVAPLAKLCWHHGSSTFYVQSLISTVSSQDRLASPESSVVGSRSRQAPEKLDIHETADTQTALLEVSDSEDQKLLEHLQIPLSHVESGIESDSVRLSSDMSGSDHAPAYDTTIPEDDYEEYTLLDVEHMEKIDFEPDEIIDNPTDVYRGNDHYFLPVLFRGTEKATLYGLVVGKIGSGSSVFLRVGFATLAVTAFERAFETQALRLV